jgi:TPR repeat protein
MEALYIAAEGGDKDSQAALGHFYLKGERVERNPELGVSWLRGSADQGSGLGHHNLAICYAMGVGIAKDVRRAVKHYRVSAAASFPSAVDVMKKLTTCAACGAENTHRVCGKCVFVSYCDARCQSRCWPHPHRARC